MRRGDLYRVQRPGGDVRRGRVFVVVSRPALIESRFSTVVCAPVYSTRRGLSTEVPVGPEEGLEDESSVVCDGLMSVPKSALSDYVGSLSARQLARLDEALRVALALDEA